MAKAEKLQKSRAQLSNWISVFVVFSAVLLIVLNLARVVANAQDNYEVYQFEKQGLQELKQEHKELEQELEYYQSYEYKKLYARDNLKLADEDEKLYQILGERKQYEVVEQDPDLFQNQSFWNWWVILLS